MKYKLSIVILCFTSYLSCNRQLSTDENQKLNEKSILSNDQIRLINNNFDIFNPGYYSKDLYYVQRKHLWFDDYNKITVEKYNKENNLWESSKVITLGENVPENYKLSGSFLTRTQSDSLYNSTGYQVLKYHYENDKVSKIDLRSGDVQFEYLSDNCFKRTFHNHEGEPFLEEKYCYTDDLGAILSFEKDYLYIDMWTKKIVNYTYNGRLVKHTKIFRDNGKGEIINKTISYTYDENDIQTALEVTNHTFGSSHTKTLQNRIISLNPLEVAMHNQLGNHCTVLFNKEGLPIEMNGSYDSASEHIRFIYE